MTKNKIRVLFFNDPMGTSDETPAEEAKYCKRWFKELVFEKKKFAFEYTTGSMDLETQKYDILVFDFGGIGMGAGGLIDSLSRQILKLIEDKPNTLFIAWSHFTNIYLKDECEKELGQYHNLFNRDVNAEELTNKIKQWISLDEKDEQ